MTQSPDSLLKHFSLIPDFRVAGRTDHKLFDILFIAVGAENMAVIRHIAMNYLSQAKHLKFGIKNRRNLAAISTDVLQRIFGI